MDAIGESLKPMTPDTLKRIFAEGELDWLAQPAIQGVSDDKIISLIDTQGFFDLLEESYPTSRDGVLAKLQAFNLISGCKGDWTITNLAAITLAKKLEEFSFDLASKAPRVIIYEGKNKLKTRVEVAGGKGYAVGFEGLVDYVHNAAPQNRYLEEAVREEVKMFPRQAIRELVANALVHQDFTIKGENVRIEMYIDRLEISNPGIPPLK